MLTLIGLVRVAGRRASSIRSFFFAFVRVVGGIGFGGGDSLRGLICLAILVVNSDGVGSGLGVGACELDGAEVGWITGAGLIVCVGFLFVTADGAGVGSAGSAGFGTGGLDRLATQALISGE